MSKDLYRNSPSCSPSWPRAPFISRRVLLRLPLIAILPCHLAHADEALDVVFYENKKQGYRLKVPVSWEKIDKSGADVLFEDTQKRSTSIGVTCNPVRIKSLEAFGSLEDIGLKLMETEKKKESTMSVSLLSQRSRAASSGALLYEYDYIIDSTRGKKRIINVVSIYDAKLYIFNGTLKCEGVGLSTSGGEEELEDKEKGCKVQIDVLRASSASFDVTG